MTRWMTFKDFVKSRDGEWPHSVNVLRSLKSGADWGRNRFQSAFNVMEGRSYVDPEKFWECVKAAELNNGLKPWKKK
jgi:hypothetical protein